VKQEQRITPRFKVSLSAHIVGIDNRPVSWKGETIDIGAGGVRFILPHELPVGNTIDYVITLSDNEPPARICCVGNVLRCEKKENSWEAAATMARYVFVRSGSVNPSHLSDAPGNVSLTFGTPLGSINFDPPALPS
jgi:hypothetical protein